MKLHLGLIFILVHILCTVSVLGTHDRFQIVENEYGKTNGRLLHLRRDGPVHTIREVEVDTSLALNNAREYIHVSL